MSDHRGLLITFEGAEASGKSTQLALLAKRLEEAGCRPVVLREPGATALGERIRELLLFGAEPRAAMAEMLLYAAARAQLLQERIAPALAAGRVVLCDRFVDSTRAYQGYGLGLPLEAIDQVHRLTCGDLWPDRTVLLVVAGEEARRRAHGRAGAGDRIESRAEAFHQRVFQGYIEIAAREPGRFLRIDGSGSPEQVAERVWAGLAGLLGPRLPVGG